LIVKIVAGIRLLEHNIEESWRDHHSLCMGLYKLRSVLQNLTGECTEPPCFDLLERAQNILEKAEIYILLHDRHEAEVNHSSSPTAFYNHQIGILPFVHVREKLAFVCGRSRYSSRTRTRTLVGA
jgi:hypothetical protein